MSETLIANVRGEVCGRRSEFEYPSDYDRTKKPKRGSLHATMVDCRCPECGKDYLVGPLWDIDYNRFLARADLLQNCFPYLSIVERESIKSGYCKKCQKVIFGLPPWMK